MHLPRNLALLAFAVTFIALACAQSVDNPSDDPGGSPPGPGSGGAAGGAGGVGGAGGSGGGLCAVDCSTIATPACQVAVCNDGSHPGAVGQCVIIDEPNDTPCDDGQFCTTEDSCQDGVCVGGPPNDCGMTPTSSCHEIVCDETSQSCSSEVLPNGTPCQGTNLCVAGGTCSSGICTGGAPVDCFFFPVPDCHVATCNPINGMCEAVVGNDGQPCVDTSDLCTVDKTCSSGTCVGGVPKDCSHLTNGCDIGVCEPTTGACTTQTVMDGQLCDDLDACTTGETCDMGVCGMGTPVTTCSQTPDGCCPSNCDETNDYDCNCPGFFLNGTCVYLADPNSFSLSGAQAVCQGLGAGWDLCTPTVLCDQQTLTYLANSGCSCTGGPTACNCASPNVYIHVTGGQSPYYIRNAAMAGCGTTACTNSVSQTCGSALCCK